MQDILEICYGLDVHRDTVVACLLKGSLDGTPSKKRRFLINIIDFLRLRRKSSFIVHYQLSILH